MRAWVDLKTRIIQNESEPEPAASSEMPAPAADGQEAWLRRAFLFTAVAGYIVLGALHPFEIEVGDETTLYLGLHFVQPFFIPTIP